MSHVPPDFVGVDFASDETEGPPAIRTRTGVMTLLPGTDASYVPVSRRSSDELMARADELRRMALTATTEEVMRALETLADRYAELAERRRAAQD